MLISNIKLLNAFNGTQSWPVNSAKLKSVILPELALIVTLMYSYASVLNKDLDHFVGVSYIALALPGQLGRLAVHSMIAYLILNQI